MNFAQSISYCFSNYANFNGRASRSEFWWFNLFVLGLEFVANIWDAALGDTSGFGAMYILVLLGTVVYKMSYVDQMCAIALEKAGNTEEAKKLRLEHQCQFDTWKEETVEEYIENYPHDYKWQI